MLEWILLKTFGVPRWLLVLLALCAFVGGGLVWHSRKVADALQESYKQGEEAEKARSREMIRKLDLQLAEATGKLRGMTDANARAIVVRADTERLLGPGKAEFRCPAAAASAGGPDPLAPTADDGGDRVPPNERNAVVPWGWLVSRAQTCDLDTNEVKAWRAWYGEVAKGFAAAQPK